MPAHKNPIVSTDRARELADPSLEQADPGVVDRPTPSREHQGSERDSGLYLCARLPRAGAVSPASVLDEIKNFVETHPDDVIIIDIQDATTPADTAQAFIDAGLEGAHRHVEAGGTAADAAGADRRRQDDHRLRRGRRWRRGARLVPAGVRRVGPGDAVQMGFGRRIPVRAEPRWDQRRAVPRQPLGDHGRPEPEHGAPGQRRRCAEGAPRALHRAAGQAAEHRRRRLRPELRPRQELAELNLELFDQVPDEAVPVSTTATSTPPTTAAPPSSAPASSTPPETLPGVEADQIVTTLTGAIRVGSARRSATFWPPSLPTPRRF